MYNNNALYLGGIRRISFTYNKKQRVMKFLISLICIMGFTQSTFAQNNPLGPIIVRTEIIKASVYSNGASITREGQLTCPLGKITLLIDHLPQTLTKANFLLKCNRNIDVLSSKLEPKEGLSKSAEDRVFALNAHIKELKFYINVYEKTIEIQENALKQLTSTLSTNNTNPSYLERIQNIKATLLNYNLKKEHTHFKINQLNNQLEKLNVKTSKQFVLTIDNIYNTPLRFQVIYRDNRVGWNPEYKLHIEDEEPIQFDYNVNVYQHSGENWDNIELSLSSEPVPIINHTQSTINTISQTKPISGFGSLKGKSHQLNTNNTYADYPYKYGHYELINDEFTHVHQVKVLVKKGDVVLKHGLTDHFGNFVLDSIPAGQYSIELKNPDFETKRIPSVTIHPTKTTEVNTNLNHLIGAYEIAEGIQYSNFIELYPFINYGNSHCDHNAVIIHQLNDSALTVYEKHVVNDLNKRKTLFNRYIPLSDHLFDYSVTLNSGSKKSLPYENSVLIGDFKSGISPQNIADNKEICILSDWKGKKFISGQAKVFYNKTDIGSTYLNSDSIIDTIYLDTH